MRSSIAPASRAFASVPYRRNPDYAAWRARSAVTAGWTWTQRSLAAFGLKGLVAYRHPDAATLQGLAARRGIDLIVDQ